MGHTTEPEWDAKSTVVYLFITGGLLLLVGSIMAFANWPTTELSMSGSSRDTGSEGQAFFGIFLMSVGQILFLTAVIATGVRLGTRTSRALVSSDQ